MCGKSFEIFKQWVVAFELVFDIRAWISRKPLFVTPLKPSTSKMEVENIFIDFYSYSSKAHWQIM